MAYQRQTADEQKQVRGAAESLFGGIRLGRISGIQVVIDWSLLIIFALVATSLGWQVLPAWHPNWSGVLTWVVAVIAASAFFASILAHELSHALVGRRHGIRVERITLFLFGGMAHMESEPPSPKAELWMAIVGPITSIVIGLGSIAVAWATLSEEVMLLLSRDPNQAIPLLSPAQTVLFWLGPLNILLGIFNMVPGFPLDGGRVLRAILWWATGDMKRATRWASGAGRAVAILLMGTGAAMAIGITVPIFGRGLGPGLWLLLIGWFLYKAAQASYGQLVMREALQNVRVDQLMRRRYESVPADLPLDELMHDYVMQSDQESFPVLHGDRPIGVVTAREAIGIPTRDWATTSVRMVLIPLHRVPTITPEADLQDAMARLQQAHVAQLLVVDADTSEIRGVLRQRDIVRWLLLQSDNKRATER